MHDPSRIVHQLAAYVVGITPTRTKTLHGDTFAAPGPVMPLKPHDVISHKYEVVGEVGRGGMGVVYRAVQNSLNRTVAVKMLFEELANDIEFRARFQQEAEGLARLNHPNIVSVFDIEEFRHTYCIIMEYLEGESLQQRIDRVVTLPEKEIASIGIQVAHGLQYAHAHGVIHRDVKPDNIFLTESGVAKLTDFGIARFMEARFKTQTGVCMGTPKFMSPEQVTGKNVDGQSDIYSLGIVLYYCATARPPFEGENPIEIATKHLYEDPVPPSQHNPAISADLEKVIMRALHKDRSVRYATADALAKALEKSQSASARVVLGDTSSSGGHATRRLESRPVSTTETGSHPAGSIDISDLANSHSDSHSPSVEKNAPRRIVREITAVHSEAGEAALPSVSMGESGVLPTAAVLKVAETDARHSSTYIAVAIVACVFIAAAAFYWKPWRYLTKTDAGDAKQALAAVDKNALELIRKGQWSDALKRWREFSAENPTLEPARVAYRIDRTESQLPARLHSEELSARRERLGRKFLEEKNYAVALAYLEGAQDLLKVTQPTAATTRYAPLLENARKSDAAWRESQIPSESQGTAAAAFEQAAAAVRNAPDSHTQVVNDFARAVSLTPNNFSYWITYAQYMLSQSFTDDARVLLQYIARYAQPNSEEKRLASQLLRQIEA